MRWRLEEIGTCWLCNAEALELACATVLGRERLFCPACVLRAGSVVRESPGRD